MTENLDRLAIFLRDLGRALHISGMPAHDLERHLNAIGRRFGVRVDSFAVLTMLSLNVVADNGYQRLEMVRLPVYDYNMARLIALEELIRSLNHLDGLHQAEEALREIMAKPPLWVGWPYVLFGALLSASFALLLGGGLAEMLCGGLVGIAFVAAQQWLLRIPQLAPAAPVILGALAAIAAQALRLPFPEQVPFITAVAGVVLLLPGFTLTVAMSELATQNLLAGTGRLAGAVVLLCMMGAGLAIGTQTATEIAVLLGWPRVSTVPAVPVPLPGWVLWPAVAVLGFSLLGFLQVPLRFAHVLVGGCLFSWAVYALVSAVLGNLVGAFAGALAVAAAGHAYNALTGQPDILLKIPGLITLVPGSMGFRGVHALMEKDSMVGIGLMTDMLLTGAVLAVGLLLADNLASLVQGRRGLSGQ